MSEYYLAIDIGASGGRHYAGCLDGGRMLIREMHRFRNGPDYDGRHLVWDVDRIHREILTGMKKCAAAGIRPRSVGIDTWGVDYVLVDDAGGRVGKAYAYRDRRTDGMDDRFDAVMPPDELYGRTGIQRILINTLYQLMAHMNGEPGDFEKARHLLMLPDYLHFLLAGEMCPEYTNASTTQLLNAKARDWDDGVIAAAGLPRELFGRLHLPGTRLGALRKGIAEEVGYDCGVVLPCTHDTGSAVAALPVAFGSDPIYLSSGTWSLIGCECAEPALSERSRTLNYTNEGGYAGTYRLLKNIMGLWMIQSVRSELAPDSGFDEIARAAEAADIDTIVDCEDQAFLSPDSMYGAIRDWCRSRDLRAPEDIGETAAVIYRSLADAYARNAGELTDITGTAFGAFHILGGGSKDSYLNRLTARRTGMTVHAGPAEATAIGNIAVQMISDGVFSDLAEARECIADSFSIKTYDGGQYAG